jgi:hypothetical protein
VGDDGFLQDSIVFKRAISPLEQVETPQSRRGEQIPAEGEKVPAVTV